MFNYICLGSSDVARSGRFFDAVLAPLGLVRTPSDEEGASEDWINYEAPGQGAVSLFICRPFDGRMASAGNGTMVALSARNWDQVKAFHAEALVHGGSSEGAPGLRPQYAPDFYAAYVRDPDGNKLAAVCRGRSHPD